eukprot:scaffold5035_cov88-Skeletonema_dohrnii-CCMP3373.AAC.2
MSRRASFPNKQPRSGSDEDGPPRKKPKYYCSNENCTNQVVKGGVCLSHGAELPKCSHEDCTKYARKGGVCCSHGAVDVRRRCSHEDCTKYARKGGVCSSHKASQLIANAAIPEDVEALDFVIPAIPEDVEALKMKS